MYLAEIFAIAAATCIATSGMLISELTGRVHVLRLARWQLTAAFLMTAAVSIALGGWRNVTLVEFGYLAASSLFGIIIASTTYFATIYSIGPRLTALMFSLTSPFALALGYLVFGETITLKQGGGILLVLAGIVLAIGLPGRREPSRKTPQIKVSWLGIALGVVTAFGQVLGSLFARPAMAAGTEPFTAMAIRSGLAAIFFTLLAVLPLPAWKQPYAFSRKMLVIAVTASFFGTGLGMSLLMAALAHGNVGIVSTLSSMTPIVILPMVWARTGKLPAATAWAGAALAVIGTALISL